MSIMSSYFTGEDLGMLALVLDHVAPCLRLSDLKVSRGSERTVDSFPIPNNDKEKGKYQRLCAHRKPLAWPGTLNRYIRAFVESGSFYFAVRGIFPVLDRINTLSSP